MAHYLMAYVSAENHIRSHTYNKGQLDTRLQGRTWAEAVKLIATTSSTRTVDYVNVTSTLFLLQFYASPYIVSCAPGENFYIKQLTLTLLLKKNFADNIHHLIYKYIILYIINNIGTVIFSNR